MKPYKDYVIVDHSLSHLVIEFSSGKFNGEQVRIENIKVDEEESDDMYISFDYTLLSGKKLSTTKRKLLDEHVTKFMTTFLDDSIKYAQDMLGDKNVD